MTERWDHLISFGFGRVKIGAKRGPEQENRIQFLLSGAKSFAKQSENMLERDW